MSKLAKKHIPVPAGVTVSINDRRVTVKGPKGELSVTVPRAVEMKSEPEGIKVTLTQDIKTTRANAGTAWSLVRNAVQGVTVGYEKILEIEGVGYKAALEGTTLVLSLGFVNPVRVPISKGLTVAVEKNQIKVAGIDKEMVGRFAAEVRALKKPEPYKGKGIHYLGEVITRKAGKKTATAGAA
ncbi:MAG TPA: 50S ribosomal protein L6 [Candidatus Paceibacterota bacterium]|nr:50S ribosomal protein L6 [Candidatus Paceibacterota bacterium]